MKPVLIIQNCDAESAGSIPDYLKERHLPSTVVHSYLQEPFPALEQIQAVINLGCPLSVTTYHEHPFLRDLYAFVAGAVRAGTPYLGVCFGGQLLAKVLGARVEANPVKEIGVYDVKLSETGRSDPLFEGFEPNFAVIQWHSDTFRIPFGAQTLAEGADCKNQAFRVGRAVGLQFHLEASAAEVFKWCEAYPNELQEVGRSREQFLEAARRNEAEIRKSNDRLLDNFFRMNQD